MKLNLVRPLLPLVAVAALCPLAACGTEAPKTTAGGEPTASATPVAGSAGDSTTASARATSDAAATTEGASPATDAAALPTTVDVPTSDVPATDAGLPGASTSPAATPAATAPAGDAGLPAGSKWLTMTNPQGRFAIPADWNEADPKILLNDDAKMQAMASTMHMSAQQLKVAMSRLTMMALAPAKDGFVDNVNVEPSPMPPPPTALPVVTVLKRQLPQLTVVKEQQVTAAQGQGIRLDYTADVGGQQVAGAMIIVPMGGKTAVITFSSSVARKAQLWQIADTAVASMAG